MEENYEELYEEPEVTKEELEGREVVSYPRLVEKPFVKKNKGFFGSLMFWKTTKNVEVNPNLKQPVLFLQRNDGYTDVIEGLKVGQVFTLIDKETGREKGILLSQNKLTTLNIEPYPKCWFGHEDEMTPYPNDMKFSSGELVSIIRQVESTKGLLKDQATLINAKMMFWLAIIGGIALLAYFGFKAGWIQALLGG